MSKQPQIWTRPLGENADVNKIEDDVAVDSGNVSFAKLFGRITAVPLEEGGIAPEREDFNALFKLLGEVAYYFMHGGIYNYINNIDYEVGSFVRYNNELYVCVTDNGPSTTIKAPTDLSYWANVKNAQKLATARTINIQDASGDNTGTGIDFDGTKNVFIKLPQTIKGNLDGKATSAEKADSAKIADSAKECSGNSASATKATQDGAGQQINTTYIKSLSVNGRTITYTKGNGATGTITTQDTNTTYSQMKGSTTSANGSAGLVPAPATGAANRYLRCDGQWVVPPDTNTTYSKLSQFTNDPGFITKSGSCASATKATQDSAGQQINSTYIKSLSVNGRTITYTKGNGSTDTITTQDTNTTYSKLSQFTNDSGYITDGHNFSSGVTVNGYKITVG